MKEFTKICIVIAVLWQANLFAQRDSILVKGTYRAFIVHKPVGFTSAKKYPVVLNFHGIFSNAAQQEAYTNFDSIADIHHFIVVYPDALGSVWNVYENPKYPNDSAFVSQLIDHLTTTISADAARIYATGFSEGGFMCYNLACQLPDKIAAFAIVSGNMMDTMKTAHKITTPVPILHIHGGADVVVSFWGVFGFASWVPLTALWWANNNHCNTTPVHTYLPNPVLADSTTEELYYYTPGPDSCEVILVQVNNGGHTWPGATLKLPLGNTCMDFNASASIWDFFSKHKLRSATGIKKENELLNSISLFPNPAKENITIAFKNSTPAVQTVSIYNMMGEKLISVQSNEISQTINISSLSTGCYYIRAETSDSFAIKKFVKEF